MPEQSVIHNEQQLRLEVNCALLDDDAVEDIVLNPDSSLWATRMGTGFRQEGQMTGSQAVCAMNTISSMRSMLLNYERPILETELPLDGSRFEGLIPQLCGIPSSPSGGARGEFSLSINIANPGSDPIKETR